MTQYEPWRPGPPEVPERPQSPTRRRGNWFTRGGWWFFVHLLSFGFLAPVPLVVAAVRTRRALHSQLALVSAGLTIGTLALIGSAERTPEGRFVGTANAIANITWPILFVGGLAALIVVRQQVYGQRATTDAARPVDPAVAGALAARERRSEARRLAADDPLLAREIRIGRPDLPRTYDDGGLVDLNSAPPGTIAEVCGLDAQLAGRIVAARQAAGRFASVEDVFAYAELPYPVWDAVRDRGVVVG